MENYIQKTKFVNDCINTDLTFNHLQKFLLDYTLQINHNQFNMSYINGIGVIYAEKIQLQKDIAVFLDSLDYLHTFIIDYSRGYRVYFFDKKYLTKQIKVEDELEFFTELYKSQVIDYFKQSFSFLDIKNIEKYISDDYFDFEPQFLNNLFSYEFFTTGSNISGNRAIDIKTHSIDISKDKIFLYLIKKNEKLLKEKNKIFEEFKLWEKNNSLNNFSTQLFNLISIADKKNFNQLKKSYPIHCSIFQKNLFLKI